MLKKRIIMHIDVNNAFLSWTAVELLKKGYKNDIRNIVSIVAGDENKRHGVVLAKSNEAKKYGIKTAETIYSAKKKYKNIEIFKPNHKLYSKCSKALFEYLSNFTPHLEKYSIDECFLDLTDMKYFIKDEIEFAYKIKDEIKEKFGFTVNIGIANNKLCAKIASDFEKPNKVHTLYDSEIKTKLWPLKIEDLFMVGKKTTIKLKSLNINTIYDLAHFPKEKLILKFKSYGEMLYNYANGIDDSLVEDEEYELKGIGNSTTYPIDIEDIENIKQKLSVLSEQVGFRIRKDKKYAYVVTLYVKFSDFQCITHQRKLKNPINQDLEIYDVSIDLLKEIDIRPIRSLGIRLNNLTTERKNQLSLFDNIIETEDKSKEKLQNILDTLKDKYGSDIVKSANSK